MYRSAISPSAGFAFRLKQMRKILRRLWSGAPMHARADFPIAHQSHKPF